MFEENVINEGWFWGLYLLQTETLSYKTIVVGCVGGGVFYNINIINIILVRNAIFKVNVPLSM